MKEYKNNYHCKIINLSLYIYLSLFNSLSLSLSLSLHLYIFCSLYNGVDSDSVYKTGPVDDGD